MKTTKQKTEQTKMTHAQQQFLLRELRGIPFYQVDVPELPVPAKVRASEKIIARHERIVNAHEKKQLRQREKLRAKFNKLADAARRTIYFEGPDKALAAVDRLKKFRGTEK